MCVYVYNYLTKPEQEFIYYMYIIFLLSGCDNFSPWGTLNISFFFLYVTALTNAIQHHSILTYTIFRGFWMLVHKTISSMPRSFAVKVAVQTSKLICHAFEAPVFNIDHYAVEMFFKYLVTEVRMQCHHWEGPKIDVSICYSCSTLSLHGA